MKNNPTIDWRKDLALSSIAYDDFPIDQVKNYSFFAKIDGELNAMIYEKGKEPVFINTYGTIRKGLLVLQEYKQILDATNIQKIIIMGEAAAFKDDKVQPFNINLSVIKTAYKNSQYDALYHHFVYDIFSIDGKRTKDWKHNISLLRSIFKSGMRIKQTPIIRGDMGLAWKTLITSDGIEGLVARGTGKNYKIMETFSVDVVVVAFGKEKMITWERGEISYVRVALMDKKGNFILSTKVGSGFSVKQRKELFYWAKDHQVESDINTGELWVNPQLIIEVIYRRRYIKDMPLIQFKDGKWSEMGRPSLGCTFIKPHFVRIRDDKRVSPHDLRPTQVPGYPTK